MLERILVPLDGSLLSERILHQVRRLLVRRDSEVLLATVLPQAPGAGSHPSGFVDREEAWDRLVELRDELVDQGVRASSLVLAGDPAEQILALSEEYEPSLIALSTHGRSGLKRWVRGSVAERILRHSRYPLLLVNPRSADSSEARHDLRFRRLLVPLDVSPTSAAIVPLAAELARLYEAEAILLHALEGGLPMDDLGTPIVGTIESPASASRVLESRKRDFAGIPTRTRIVTGRAAPAILDAIESEKIDLVAMTTHGRRGISRWLYGSVAEHVLRNGTCPLLVWRAVGVRAMAPLAA
jgi:nucleotide-binding universal stress UspA family protein